MSRLDEGALLRRALERSADSAGITLAVERSDFKRWASATFTGARHAVTLRAMDGDGLDWWLGALPEADLPVRGQLVADLKIVSVTRAYGAVVAMLEVLTVADR